MRKISLFFLMVMASAALRAQFVAFSAGPVFTKVRYTTFSYLAESYNRFHAGNLTQELKPFNFATGKFLSFCIGGGPAAVEISYNNFREKSKAVFTSGETRVFDLRTGYFDMMFNLGKGEEGAGFWLTTGFGIGRVNLFSYTEYADGAINYNLNQMLNGQYTGLYIAGIVGVKAQIPITESVLIQVRAEKLFKQVNYLGFQLHDVSNSKEGTGVDTDQLPADYYHYNEIMGTQTTLPEQYNVLPDVAGLRFSIALTYKFGDN